MNAKPTSPAYERFTTLLFTAALSALGLTAAILIYVGLTIR